MTLYGSRRRMVGVYDVPSAAGVKVSCPSPERNAVERPLRIGSAGSAPALRATSLSEGGLKAPSLRGAGVRWTPLRSSSADRADRREPEPFVGGSEGKAL